MSLGSNRVTALSHRLTSLWCCVAWGLSGVCALLAMALAIRSTHTHLTDDVGFLHYLAWLVNVRGFVPYIDIHETSFPGSFALYGVLAWLGQYSSAGFHAVNIASALLCTALLANILRHFHWCVAAVGSTLFAFWYFAQPNALFLQRDYLVIPFILGAITVMLATPATWRSVVAGILFACASSIKPHAAIGAPLVILFLANGTATPPANLRQSLRAIAASTTGFIALWCAIAAWLLWCGNWQPFLRMATEYLPLYQRMNGIHLALTPAQHWQNAIAWVGGTTMTLGPPILLCLLGFWRNHTITALQQRLAVLLASLWLAYLVYVGIGGKFWDYHTMPANLFYCALFGIQCMPWNTQHVGRLCLHAIALATTVFWLWAVYPWADSTEQARCVINNVGEPCAIAAQDQYQAEDQLARYLQTHLQPGERVEPQATSTVGTVFTALLRAQVLPVTPYLESFPLYHDADTAYVQGLREDMLTRLQAHPPRYVIRPANFFAPGGAVASPFTALEQFLSAHYTVVQDAQLPSQAYFTVLEYRKP